MKVCITDATYKHSLALARYLRRYDPTLELVGMSQYVPRFSPLFSKYYSRMVAGPLTELVQRENPDVLIPTGTGSVAEVSAMQYPQAVLPNPESVSLAFDKLRTLRLAEKLGIPAPKTCALQQFSDIETIRMQFPCVVKGILEAGKNVVSYPRNKSELRSAVEVIAQDSSQRQLLPIVQEYVPGVGLGFFGFYQRGKLKRFYMHQRIRELPITGGASTAAKTIFHQAAFEYGKKILDHLDWHGVAMVEFKYDPQTERLCLMEINPKFWGSTELGLAAGVNFGELLVRTVRGEDIPADLSPDSYKKIQFFWPCEGDLLALFQSRNWSGFMDYSKGGYESSFPTNGLRLNVIRLIGAMR